MKANVNYNLEGDEEPGVFGAKHQLYPLLGMVPNSWAPIAMLQNICIW